MTDSMWRNLATTVYRYSKYIKDIEDIRFAIVKSYLKSVDKKHGLLLNFAKVKLEIKRVIYDE